MIFICQYHFCRFVEKYYKDLFIVLCTIFSWKAVSIQQINLILRQRTRALINCNLPRIKVSQKTFNDLRAVFYIYSKPSAK